AMALATDLAALGAIRVLELGEPDWSAFAGVIQATTLGSNAQPGNPAAGQSFARRAIALDMVYEPERTAFLIQAEAQGAVAVGGVEMLLRQMQAQYRLARGTEPPMPPLRDALARALRARSSDPHRALALIGPRASGKSTIGRALAERLGRAFLDADEEIERRHGRSIAEWLPSDAASFRAAEADLLIELLMTPDVVVALGGGVVEDATSRQSLADHGAVLWLHVSPEEQERRRECGDLRPALSTLPRSEEIAQLHRRRLPWYRLCADRCVESVGDPESTLTEALHAARELGIEERA
ncbi:MAG: hypothetical protein O3A20_10575, partial [Planctomycetota bacterium]|nr:hypothetical protein [Planctomycetota bacterium]